MTALAGSEVDIGCFNNTAIFSRYFVTTYWDTECLGFEVVHNFDEISINAFNQEVDLKRASAYLR